MQKEAALFSCKTEQYMYHSGWDALLWFLSFAPLACNVGYDLGEMALIGLGPVKVCIS